VINLTMFAVPMVLLYFVGVFAGYLLNVQRDQQRFPWMAILLVVATVILMTAGVVGVLIWKYGFRLTGAWPFLVR
jgi:sec-independent protein translocase protein TatC